MKKQIRLLAGALWLLTTLALSQAFAQTSQSGPVAPTTTTASELGSIGLDALPTLGDQQQTADDGSARSARTPVVKPKSDRSEDDSTADSDAPEDNTRSASRTQAAGANEFQRFVAESSGKLLPMFGQSLFEGVPSTFAPLDEAPVSSDYIVGPGDEVIIRTWGQVDVDVRTVVDRNGVLIIPRIGAITVAGVRNHELEKLVRKAIGRVYRNFELIVNLGKLRALQVFIVGQARQPGSFTVSPMSTLVSTLFASGGPSAQGTMRRIVVKRANKVVTEFDLYDMLLKGDTSKDVRLQQGDVIFIPPIGPLVAMMGSVNAPAIYELKGDNATTLSDLLGWAGGITTTASGQRAVLERIVDRQVRTLVELSLDREGLNQQLRDGDIVNIYPIQPRVANAVALRGFVNQPARVPWREGLRVKDLIPEKEAVLTPDYWRQRQQIISFRGESLSRETAGAAGELRFADEVNWEYAVVERLREDLTTVLIPFHLGKAVIDSDPKHNLLLQPNDVVVIFSKSDVRVPIDAQKKFVYLEGEFVQGGVYQALPGETLQQIVARAGGVTPHAYLFGAEFTRRAVKLQQQSQLDELVNRAEQELLRSAVNIDASAATTESAILNRAQQ
ncbi:MAG: SLBB domain-containing protein, partial [Burkholderiaceae bacterium]|nr:SLBB domain-containing protein [Burkholderiaceae bacterium]